MHFSVGIKIIIIIIITIIIIIIIIIIMKIKMKRSENTTLASQKQSKAHSPHWYLQRREGWLTNAWDTTQDKPSYYLQKRKRDRKSVV